MKEIKLKNKRIFLLDSSLNIHLERAGDKLFLKNKFQNLRQSKSKSMVFFHNLPSESPSSSKALQRLSQSAKEAAFKTDYLSPQKIQNKDFRYIQRSVQKLMKAAGKGPVIFFYMPGDKALLHAFTVMCAYNRDENLKEIQKFSSELAGAPLAEEQAQNVMEYISFMRKSQEKKARGWGFLWKTSGPKQAESVSSAKQAKPVSTAVSSKASNHSKASKAKPVSAAKQAKPVSAAEPVSTAKQVKPAAKIQRQEAFEPSPFTIRFKLLGIISSIIFASLAVMIYFSSRLFNNQAEVSIQENNLNLARVYGSQIETQLQSIRYTAQIFLDSAARAARAKQSSLKDQFFKDHSSFFYISLGRLQKDRYQPQIQFFHDAYLKKNKLRRTSISRTNLENGRYFKQALSSYSAFNASMSQVPVLGLSFTSKQGAIIVIYLQPTGLLSSFQRSGAVQVYVVNGQGDIIAHKDSNILVARANFLKQPIVQSMLSSTVEAGQKRYHYDGVEFMGSFQRLDLGRLGVIAAIEADTVFAPVYRIQIINFLIITIVMCIAFIVVFYFSKSITIPITSLVESAGQIEEGNYNLELHPIYRDEIGRLTYSFSNMATGLEEREKMKDAFGKFVNKEIAERVLKGDIKLGGERKEAAIFFSDLRGFTALSEGLMPEQVVSFLNAYFTSMVQCVHETHGIVDKYIGDAIMAHWGAIGGRGNNTENAINAAIMMRRALARFNAVHKGKFPIARIGCGINTGSVISGQIGSEDRLEYTVIGDAVNLASRIEALNKPFATDILISSEAYSQVANIYKVEKMPSIKVKGKEKPQAIYAIIGRLDDPQCPPNLQAVRAILGAKQQETGKKAASGKEEKFEILGKM